MSADCSYIAYFFTHSLFIQPLNIPQNGVGWQNPRVINLLICQSTAKHGHMLEYVVNYPSYEYYKINWRKTKQK